MVATPLHLRPFFVRQSGLTYGTEGMGAIVAFDEKSQAEADVADRNKRAEKMGVKARYEFVAN